MSSKGASRLGAGLISRKGEAAPSPAAEPTASHQGAAANDSPLTALSAEALQPGSATTLPRGTQGTIAVTVRLDAGRYERLKIHGVRRRLSNQEILVKALDAYLNVNAD